MEESKKKKRKSTNSRIQVPDNPLQDCVNFIKQTYKFATTGYCEDPMVNNIVSVAVPMYNDPEWTLNREIHTQDNPSLENFIFRTFLTAHKLKIDKLALLHPLYVDGDMDEYIQRARALKSIGPSNFTYLPFKKLGYSGTYEYAFKHGQKLTPIIKDLLHKGLGPYDFAAELKPHIGALACYHLGRFIKGMYCYDPNANFFDMNGHQKPGPNAQKCAKIIGHPIEVLHQACVASGLPLTLYETESISCEYVKVLKYRQGIVSFDKKLQSFIKEFKQFEHLLPYPLVGPEKCPNS